VIADASWRFASSATADWPRRSAAHSPLHSALAISRRLRPERTEHRAPQHRDQRARPSRPVSVPDPGVLARTGHRG
jgi:hypothetical protein